MVGVLLACGPVYAALNYGLKRWYAIAGLFVLSGLVAPIVDVPSVFPVIGLQMSLVGVILLLMGFWLLVSFIRANPLMEEDGLNAGG
jgi:hypothetical protein